MIFIDTGAFLARHLKSDQYHERAIKSWEKLRERFPRAYTSNFVVSETLTFLGRRTDYQYASEVGHNIYASSFLTILRPDHADETEALKWMSKYADLNVSFTDCVSFSLMKRSRITQVFGYDQRHFESAGFLIWE
ncbi:MAG TPA: PIN domain-containing protein [Bdellovibrionota bacterium]|nr:PIN domain-containing protein [Bdellovibrionota bacterium]